MSMIGGYRRLTLGQLEDLQSALQDNSEAVSDLLYPEERSYDKPDLELEIAKAWHGIEFLLYGKEDASPSLLNVVMGGAEVGDDIGYGPARYLLPEQVKEVSQTLDGLEKAELRKQFSPEAFEAADIYPGGWTVGEPDATFEWIWGKLSAVRELFREAAQHGDVIMLYLS